MFARKKKFFLLIVTVFLITLIACPVSAENISTVNFTVMQPQITQSGVNVGDPENLSFDVLSDDQSFTVTYSRVDGITGPNPFQSGQKYCFDVNFFFSEPVKSCVLYFKSPFVSSFDKNQTHFQSWGSNVNGLSNVTISNSAGWNSNTLVIQLTDISSPSVFCHVVFIRNSTMLTTFAIQSWFGSVVLDDGSAAAAEYERSQAEASSGSATSSAQSSTNQISSLGSGVTGALQGLVSACSTSSTTASWTFPAIKIPAVQGLFPEYELSTDKEISFNSIIDGIPSDIMSIVRALTTIALVVFCIKEIFSTVQYVVNLNGGGSD